MWCASTPCGVYDIEVRSASDSPAYVALGPQYAFIADKDSLDEAKEACQADFERRILSAIDLAPVPSAREERLAKALRALHHAVCGDTGFAAAVRAATNTAYPWPALDEAEALALASPAVAEEAEPVAWLRMNAAQTSSTGVTDVKLFADQWQKSGDVVVPLYTHPRPTPAAAVIEARDDDLDDFEAWLKAQHRDVGVTPALRAAYDDYLEATRPAEALANAKQEGE
jgi:hypothetical protein